MKTKLSVLWKELSAIRLFVSENDSRYVLTGILFDVTPSRVLMVATDGRRLSVIKSEGKRPENSCSFVLPVFALKHLESKASADDQILIEHDADERTLIITPFAEGITFGVRAIDGDYPNWKGVIPKATGAHCNPYLYFQVGYLASYERVAAIYKAAGFHLTFSGGNLEPGLVHITEVRNFFSVIMPMRDDDRTISRLMEIPDWLELDKPKSTETTEAA